MDIADAAKSEVLRPLATVFVPGMLAVSPYVIVAQHYVPRVLTFWHDHDAAFTAIIVACMLAAGLLLEDLGALLESQLIDPRLEHKDPDHIAVWRQYLQLRIKDEYVGQRYLRTIVTRLKFELAMLPAIISLWLGLLWVQCIHSVWTTRSFFVLSGFLASIGLYLFIEARLSAGLLSSTRKLLVSALAAADNAPPAV